MPVIIAVIHDILITGGVYSLTGREVTSGTVAAFLTILGYSLYDTVIVFDRVRENVPRLPRATFSQIVNRSMSEVLTRSLITGLSSVFLVTVLFIFGGATLKDFAFAMMVGLASGTYSSIFIASPVLTHWKEREPAYRRRRERIEEQMGRVPAFPEENVVARTRVARGAGPGGDAGGRRPARRAGPLAEPGRTRAAATGVLPQPPAPAPTEPPARRSRLRPAGRPTAAPMAATAADRRGRRGDPAATAERRPSAPSSARRAPPPCAGCASSGRRAQAKRKHGRNR